MALGIVFSLLYLWGLRLWYVRSWLHASWRLVIFYYMTHVCYYYAVLIKYTWHFVQTLGEFHRLVQELRSDGDRFRRYFRMTTQQFDYVLDVLSPAIARVTTNYRASISPAERLAITLRFAFTHVDFCLNEVRENTMCRKQHSPRQEQCWRHM